MNKKTILIVTLGTLGLATAIALMVGMSTSGKQTGTAEITTTALTTAAITTIAEKTATTTPSVTYDFSNDVPDITTTAPEITMPVETTPENVQTLAPVDTLAPELSAEIDAGNIIIKPAETEKPAPVVTTTAKPITYETEAAGVQTVYDMDGNLVVIEDLSGMEGHSDLDGPTYDVYAQ